MSTRSAIAAGLGMLVLCFSAAAGAQQLPEGIPNELEPWVGWVVYEVPDVVCPDVAGARTCRWPGELEVRATSTGATFSMTVFADREVTFGLPGNPEYWPTDVRVDGRPGTVLAVAETPQVRVESGRHRITGAFAWPALPEVLAVPTDVAGVDLQLEGTAVPRPRIDTEGRLWLRDGTTGGGDASEADSVRASIYRRVEDGVPLSVTTRLRLNVSGRAREVGLGKILLDGSRPVEARASIPVQVGVDGRVTVYVRPGTHDVEIDAVLPENVDRLQAPTPTPDFYDPQEVWIWIPDESVRSVERGGLTPVDPERTSLPGEWKGYTTFLAEPGDALTLSVTRRGVAEPQPNMLSLSRDLWLDLDGTGYTIRDQLTGQLHQDWRLNYSSANGAQLGRVAQSGENLLITEEPGSGLAGVELRRSALDVTAEIRMEKARETFGVVGWDHDVQSLDAALHLPPGWTLFHTEGVDTVEGTWVGSWTPWDFFFVLIVALVIGRLFGWPWAGVSFVALVLSHGHSGAPEWIWIHLIASLALLRVLPPGWWRKAVVAYRGVALVALVVIFAPYAHDEVLVALHPQVSMARPHSGATFGGADDRFVQVQMADEAMPAEAALVEEDMRMELERSDELTVRKAKPKRAKGGSDRNLWGSSYSDVSLQQVDPSAVVQTGPGLPNWQWSSWHLDWTGPVRKDHEVRLWLVSPLGNGLFGFARLALLLLVALLLIAPRDMYWERRREPPRWWRKLFGSGLAVFLAVGFAGFTPTRAYAEEAVAPPQLQQQYPGNAQRLASSFDDPLLDDLRARIVAETTCPSPCVAASSAGIEVDGLEFEMTADVSAAEATAWTLPGPPDALWIESVRIDGRPTNELRRDASGMVQVRLPEGPHTVQLVGTLADRNVVTIQFDEATRPKRVSFSANAWTVDGIGPTGVPDNSLQLTRTADAETEPEDAATGAVELPPWYQVERVVALGMPWQILTTVTRRDTTRPQLVKIPLLDGQKVITEGIRVDGGDALVDFARDQGTVNFVSEIPIGSKVKLSAATDVPWTETWRVDCSRIWRCSFSELPPVSIVTDGTWKPVWRPWPGESLEVTVRKPSGASGQPKTVEDVHYQITPGQRLMQASLQMTVRASQGDWQEVTLPPDAELQSVTIDGSNRTIRPQDGVVRLPVQPGTNRFDLRWQQPWSRDFVDRAPEVDIGSEAANATITIERGGERWLLSVRDSGMTWGPAILFWPHLLILLILALVLSTIPRVPVKMHEWLLLAIGLSQIPVFLMLPIVFWFVLLAWRRHERLAPWWKFDIVQLAIAFLTLLALISLYMAVEGNLLLDIDMQVDGQNSSNTLLNWYTDRVGSTLPTPAIVSLPILVWRGLMFLWSLWLVVRLINWARWGWESFSAGGWWKFPTPRNTPRRQGADGTPGGPEGKTEPDQPKPTGPPAADFAPVERNARDGELVHVEISLGSGSAEEDLPEVQVESLDLSGDISEPVEVSSREPEGSAVDSVPIEDSGAEGLVEQSEETKEIRPPDDLSEAGPADDGEEE